jgi:hypothetical protein
LTITRPADRAAEPASAANFRKPGFVRQGDHVKRHGPRMLAGLAAGTNARQALGFHDGDGRGLDWRFCWLARDRSEVSSNRFGACR